MRIKGLLPAPDVLTVSDGLAEPFNSMSPVLVSVPVTARPVEETIATSELFTRRLCEFPDGTKYSRVLAVGVLTNPTVPVNVMLSLSAI